MSRSVITLAAVFLLASDALSVNDDVGWAASLKDTYKNGEEDDDGFGEGHHGWDVDAKWVQSGPNGAECPVDKEGGVARTEVPWIDHSADLEACKKKAEQYNAKYISVKGGTCRVSKSCKNTYKDSSGSTVNEVPKQASGWKIYATGLACSVPTLAKYPNAKCNVAKCRGAMQDNSVMAGDLECGLYPKFTNSASERQTLRGKSCSTCTKTSHKLSIGATCLDNLSSAYAYLKLNDGYGLCTNMMGGAATLATNTYVPLTDKSMGANGVLSKFGARQVPGTDDKTGVLFVKRVRCNSKGSCDTFKTGLCIKCPAAVWGSTNANDQTEKFTAKFVSCCVLGENKYAGKNCPNSLKKHGGAFTATNSADADLKENFECTNAEHLDRAKALLAGA